MVDETEPAIPIKAAITPTAYRDLVDLADAHGATLGHPGVLVDFDITEAREARLRAVVTFLPTRLPGQVDLGAAVKRTATGALSGGGFVQWTWADGT